MDSVAQEFEERLIDFGVGICKLLEQVPRDLVGIHVTKQLIRSASSPAANYAEARGAESRRDFVHKMQIGLKELRETSVWLRFTDRVCGKNVDASRLCRECDELIAIFVKSITTAKAAMN